MHPNRAAGWFLAIVAFATAGVLGGPVCGQVPLPAPVVVAPSESITVRVVDAAGEPLAAGTQLAASVEWHGFPPSGIAPPVESVTAGPDGAVRVSRARVFGEGHTWLRLERTDDGGRRERAFVPLRRGLDVVALLPEERLASGTVLDENGAPLPPHSVRLELVGGGTGVGEPRGQDRVGARFVERGAAFELWGWRTDAGVAVRAWYPYRGPWSDAVPFAYGEQDVRIVLPSTGYLQVQLRCAVQFPERAAFAVLRRLEPGVAPGLPTRHFLIPRHATNIRLPIGAYAVTCELNGVAVADFGAVQIKDRAGSTFELDLRAARLFVVDVVDADGQPIAAARVRVLGSPDEPLSRCRIRIGDEYRNAIVVATMAERVDLEVSEFGYRPVRVDGVDGDRTVVLEKERR